jgi:hypothetical protein
MEMNPKMLEILKKAKAIDKAAKKYDSNPEIITKKRSSGGLYDELGVPSENTQYISENSIKNNPELYEDKVKSSKLPPAIKEAMLKNPIPQPSSVNDLGLTKEQIREINGEPDYYNENDEIDFYDNPVPPTRKKSKPIQEQKSSNGGGVYMTPDMIRKIVNEEIKRILPKVAPKIIEHYLQQGLIKENLEILRKIKTK